MTQSAIPSPKKGRELIDEYFIENRNRLLEVAAFLDRLDRSGEEGLAADFRMRAFGEALQVLASGGFPRVDQIHMAFSDPTTEPLAALDQKSAKGAYDPGAEVR